MATIKKYPSAYSSTSWVNPTNAYVADGVYATSIPANYETQSISFYGFNCNLPSGSTINSVTVNWKEKGTVPGSLAFFIQTRKNDVQVGTETSYTEVSSFSERVNTKTLNGTWSISELNDNTMTGLSMLFSVYRPSGAENTYYLDYVELEIDVTLPPQRAFVQII